MDLLSEKDRAPVFGNPVVSISPQGACVSTDEFGRVHLSQWANT